MMKKWLALILAALMAMTMCTPVLADEDDNAKFIEEYETLNGQLDRTGLYMLPEVDLPEDVPFDYEDIDDIEELLTKESGVLYVGFPSCPWCRQLVPALIYAWYRTNSAEEITYMNIYDLRPTRSLDEEGNVVETVPPSPEYAKLVELLYDHLRPFTGAKDETIKHIYSPMVVFVREGNIEYVHIGTVEGHDRGETMTDEEFTGLVDLLAQHMEGLLTDD